LLEGSRLGKASPPLKKVVSKPAERSQKPTPYKQQITKAHFNYSDTNKSFQNNRQESQEKRKLQEFSTPQVNKSKADPRNPLNSRHPLNNFIEPKQTASLTTTLV